MYKINHIDISENFHLWPHIAKLLESLPPNSNVLDIGCGLKHTQLIITSLPHSQSICDICITNGLNIKNIKDIHLMQLL